jgi:pimeloyl-ACP methyl ester carboxylesterase
MPSIRRPHATVAYDVVGDGPPVILGHSLFCTRSMWRGVVDALAHEYRFINVELRGHGESTAEAPFSLNDLVDDWISILDQESVDRAILCGLSAGGMTAMRLALRAPERVYGMALLDTSADREPLVNRVKNGALAWGYGHFGLLPSGALLAAMFAPQTVRNRNDLTSSLLDEVHSFDRSQISHAIRAAFGRDAVDLSGVTVPTLVMVGEHDAATPPSRARRIAATVKGAVLAVIPGAGHLTTLEQPAAVVEHLRPFFARCVGRASR